MIANKTIKVSCTLVLDEKEALWLRDFMQNSLMPSETGEDRKYQDLFFNAINQFVESNEHE